MKRKLPNIGPLFDGLSPSADLQHALENRLRARLDERSAWSSATWIPCADGKARRIEPSIEPLVNGISNRVGRLRAYGNAIVPQVGTEFVSAFMECMP